MLEGLKILDLTRVLSGPYCTMMLADLGAEVIKIERPGIGDDSREYGPFINGESAYFMGINRNKKSIAIDLKHEKGKQLFKDLAKDVDIIVENYRPGTMEKLGLGYDVIESLNPEVIFCSISGFGQYGPMSRKAAYDGVVQAMGGIMSITGEKNGKPLRVGTSIGDIVAGLFGIIGILGAVNQRNTTGKGQHLDIAMLDSIVSILENAISRYQVTGVDPRPDGNTHASIFPFETFETADNEIMIAAGNDTLWAKLCTTIGREDLITDERFKTNPKRGQNHDAMYEELNKSLRNRTSDEWYRAIDEAGIPCSPVNTVSQVMKHPQVLARNTLLDVEHPVAGKSKLINNPIKSNLQSQMKFKAAPVLGSDGPEILKEYLGYTDEMINNLYAEKVLYVKKSKEENNE